jgi:hypothetical protein
MLELQIKCCLPILAGIAKSILVGKYERFD